MRIMKELLGDISHHIIPHDEEIALHYMTAGGPDQEAYFLIRREQSHWNVYLVQRGKTFQRYQSESKELAEVCACLLFWKQQIRLAPFSWAALDKLVQEGQMAEAIRQVEQETVAPVPISLQSDQAGYHVIYQGELLHSCTNAREALRAYRYMRLHYQSLSEACDRVLSLCPQLAAERDRMLFAIMR